MRYAVYFVPGDESPLGRFGARLFGRWPDGRIETDVLQHPEREARVGRAARYGFHATLKAPFRLAAGRSADELHAAVETLVSDCMPIPLDPLAVVAYAQGEDTWALCCDRPAQSGPAYAARDAQLDCLAVRCVQELDALRAPLDARERARRRPAELSPLARERLERWGYPWVGDGFRFHMTLARADARVDGSARGNPSHSEPFDRWLNATAAQALAAPAILDRLAICVEPEAGAPLQRVAEFPLRARSA